MNVSAEACRSVTTCDRIVPPPFAVASVVIYDASQLWPHVAPEKPQTAEDRHREQDRDH
jgi:hypothetical protein